MSADLLAAFGTGSSEVAADTDRLTKNIEQPSALIDTDTWQPWPRPSHQASQPVEEETLWRSHNGATDVLFDADEEDFGDFEKAKSDVQISTSRSHEVTARESVNLLDLDGVQNNEQKLNGRLNATSQIPSLPQSTPHDSGPDDDWGAFEDIQGSEVHSQIQDVPEQIVDPTVIAARIPKDTRSIRMHALKPQTHSPQSQQHPASSTDDDWDEWNDIEGVTTPVSDITKTKPAVPSTKQEQPTNVPPPAVLLSLTPKVLSALSTNAALPQKSTETGNEAVQAYRVSARLVAGRTLRWKRDTILAQSMRIGAAGRSGGMKLTVLDKGEARKEDQEVEEMLTAWSRHSLKLNAAIAKAKLPKPPLSLSNNITVRTAAGPDIVNASHPCPVCGLRRNERINGIDVNISDTFGEFWVEHWGHKDCHDFWYQYENLLDQR